MRARDNGAARSGIPPLLPSATPPGEGRIESGAIRVLVALVRMIQDFWARDGPRLHDVATGGVGDSFVLLPRILGYWGSFQCFCARFPPREASKLQTNPKSRN